MSTTDVAERTVTAFNKHDPSAFSARYADDAVVYDPAYPEPLTGRAAIEQDMNDLARAFPDAHGELEKVLVEGDTAAIELEVTGTHEGPLSLPEVGTEVPATGRKVDIHFASFLRTDERDQIVEEHRYYDVGTMLRQLGLKP